MHTSGGFILKLQIIEKDSRDFYNNYTLVIRFMIIRYVGQGNFCLWQWAWTAWKLSQLLQNNTIISAKYIVPAPACTLYSIPALVLHVCIFNIAFLKENGNYWEKWLQCGRLPTSPPLLPNEVRVYSSDVLILISAIIYRREILACPHKIGC